MYEIWQKAVYKGALKFVRAADLDNFYKLVKENYENDATVLRMLTALNRTQLAGLLQTKKPIELKEFDCVYTVAPTLHDDFINGTTKHARSVNEAEYDLKGKMYNLLMEMSRKNETELEKMRRKRDVINHRHVYAPRSFEPALSRLNFYGSSIVIPLLPLLSPRDVVGENMYV